MTPQEKDKIRKMVKEVMEYGKDGYGRINYIDFLYGDTQQSKARIAAYCYDCMGWYADGTEDCKCTKCPLYPDMPYNPVLGYKLLRRNQTRMRNVLFPMDERIYPDKVIELRKRKVSQEGLITARKLRTRKYPQEITQKEPS
jgi:hypothetical protein